MFSLQDYIRKEGDLSRMGLKTLSDEELTKFQSILLDMLKDIAYFCDDNNLRYVLAGGSALGAVRHGGFIPWDDDIDLMMPREDYNRFIELFDSSLSEKYYIASPSMKHNNSFHNIQVIKKDTIEKGIWDQSKFKYSGVCVDINAIDYVPENYILYHIKGVICDLFFFLVNSKMMCQCRTKLSDDIFSKSVVSWLFYGMRLLIGKMLFFVSYPRLCELYDNLISSSKASAIVSIPPGRNHYFKETRPLDVLLPFKKSEFSGESVYLPNKTNEYLTKLFGSHYMELPPEEKRERHAFVELKLI